MEKHPETLRSFEETYPQYPFSELVRLGVGPPIGSSTDAKSLEEDDFTNCISGVIGYRVTASWVND